MISSFIISQCVSSSIHLTPYLQPESPAITNINVDCTLSYGWRVPPAQGVAVERNIDNLVRVQGRNNIHASIGAGGDGI